MSTTPAIGDPVMFEGQPSRITAMADGKVEFTSNLVNDDGTAPRFRTVALLADLMWSNRLSAWYLFGRVLGKRRGGVGEDQRRAMADLRDRGLIPARLTRKMGDVPAPGEQHGLYCDLVLSAPAVNWNQEMRNVSLGEGFSDQAKAAVDAHVAGFKSKRLNHGYADKDDGDPGYDQFIAARGGK